MDGIKEKINTVLSKYPVVDKVFTNLSEKIKVEKGNELYYVCVYKCMNYLSWLYYNLILSSINCCYSHLIITW